MVYGCVVWNMKEGIIRRLRRQSFMSNTIFLGDCNLQPVHPGFLYSWNHHLRLNPFPRASVKTANNPMNRYQICEDIFFYLGVNTSHSGMMNACIFGRHLARDTAYFGDIESETTQYSRRQRTIPRVICRHRTVRWYPLQVPPTFRPNFPRRPIN